MGNSLTRTATPGHRARLRRAFIAFGREVIAARPGQYPAPTFRQSLIAWRAAHLALLAATVKRTRPGYNPLSVAHDMAEMAKSAPHDCPCELTRLDFERIAVDALHLARLEGGAA